MVGTMTTMSPQSYFYFLYYSSLHFLFHAGRHRRSIEERTRRTSRTNGRHSITHFAATRVRSYQNHWENQYQEIRQKCLHVQEQESKQNQDLQNTHRPKDHNRLRNFKRSIHHQKSRFWTQYGFLLRIMWINI